MANGGNGWNKDSLQMGLAPVHQYCKDYMQPIFNKYQQWARYPVLGTTVKKEMKICSHGAK